MSFTPQSQTDVTWIADTLIVVPPYNAEGVPFVGNAITDPVTPGCCGRDESTCSAP